MSLSKTALSLSSLYPYVAILSLSICLWHSYLQRQDMPLFCIGKGYIPFALVKDMLLLVWYKIDSFCHVKEYDPW